MRSLVNYLLLVGVVFFYFCGHYRMGPEWVEDSWFAFLWIVRTGLWASLLGLILCVYIWHSFKPASLGRYGKLYLFAIILLLLLHVIDNLLPYILIALA